MKKETSTIFKVTLLLDSRTPAEEGFLQLWKHRGVLKSSTDRIAFESLDELGAQIRNQLRRERIKWAKPK